MVRAVMGGVVWVLGGARRCRVWGPVMGFPFAAAGGGNRGGVCRGGIDINPLLGASACRVCGLVSGGGGGGWCGAGTAGAGGGGGGCCAGLGSRRSCQPCGCCMCAPCGPCGPWLVAVSRWGWEAAAWASRWGCGPQVMGDCRRMVRAGIGCGWGGCWWWWGAPTRPCCCRCACAAPRGSMGVYGGPYIVSPCSGGGKWCSIAWCWC